MRFELVISTLLHAALLAWALISIEATPDRKIPKPDPVIAEIITESDLVRIRQGSRDAKLGAAVPKESKTPAPLKKEAPKPRPAAAPPPPAAEPPPPEPVKPEPAKPEPPPEPAKPEPAKPEPPKPAPPDKAALEQKLADLAAQQAVEDQRRAEAAKAAAEAAAKAKAAADAKAKAEARAKAIAKAKAQAKARAQAKAKADALAKEKAKLDTDRLSALLDKTPDPKSAPAAAPQPPAPTTAKGPVRGDPQGRDTRLSADEASFLAGLMRQAVSRCWNINAGLDGIDKIVVKVEIRLNRDGRLAAQPKVVNSQASPVFRDAADSAVRALVQCEPYELPADKYAGGWEHMILTFDPARMF